MSTALDLRTEPGDPLALQVAARIDTAVDMLTDALTEVARAGMTVSEAVGHNRPMDSADQARFLMALQQAAACVGAYQTLALLEQSQRETGGTVVPLGTLSDDPDPLAGFRLPDGTVCFTTRDAGAVGLGDWVQACHGDQGWTRIDGIHPSGALVGLDLGDGRRWWERTGAIRVACTPTEAVYRQGGAEEVRP